MSSKDSSSKQHEPGEVCKICGHIRSSHSAIGICFESTCGCTDFNDEHGTIAAKKAPLRWGIKEWVVFAILLIAIVAFVLTRI